MTTRFHIGWLLPALLALLLGGCLDTASNKPSDSSGTGELTISLTDAEGDFIRYVVDVTHIRLTRADGAEVETLPQNTQVDFAQYVDMSELLIASQVPAGNYVQAWLHLDYSQADILVEDAGGNAVAVSHIEDRAGNPITTLAVKVSLEGRDRLRIAPGIPAHLSLDFDLHSSNQAIFGDDGVRLIVEPVLLAEVNPERPKIHRLRGPLNRVEPGQSRFSVYLRPFLHTLDEHRRHFGQADILGNDNTVYEIDGISYVGDEGLRALARLPRLSPVVALGEARFNPRRFLAREVYAGSSVPGGSLDVVRGHVVARQGQQLTVRGATLIQAGGGVIFGDQVKVTLGEATVVHRQGGRENLDTGAISVGQRVSVFGTLTNAQAGNLSLDASNGRVRLLTTRLRGSVISADTSAAPPLVLDLQAIGRRAVGQFNFSGTGREPSLDADPNHYETDTGNLSLASLNPGSPVLVFGFATPFGSAPADFEAQSVTEVSATRATLVIAWRPASTTAITRLDGTGMTFDISEAGRFQQVVRNGVRTELASLDNPPALIPDASGGLYIIHQAGSRHAHGDFASFATDLQARLDDGARLAHISAHGRFDDASATLSAKRLRITLE